MGSESTLGRHGLLLFAVAFGLLAWWTWSDERALSLFMLAYVVVCVGGFVALGRIGMGHQGGDGDA